MIDGMTKVLELEREMKAKLDLTEREKQLLEALQYLIDKFSRRYQHQSWNQQ